MGIKLTKLPKLSCEDLDHRETLLLQLLREREECIQQLTDEIARLKGEKEKPKIKPSRLEPKDKAEKEGADAQESPSQDSKAHKKRPGSQKRHKTASLPIHETTIIQATAEIPPGLEFKGNPRLHCSRADYQTS